MRNEEERYLLHTYPAISRCLNNLTLYIRALCFRAWNQLVAGFI